MSAGEPARVEALTLGCSQLGGLHRPMGEAAAREVLETAWDVGIRSFDTAPHYGGGQSERRLGSFLATVPRDEVSVSTKVGRLLIRDDELPDGTEGFFGADPYRRVWDFTSDGVRASLLQSLARLGLDHVDAVYLHDPDDHLDAALSTGLAGAEQARLDGLTTHVGAGMNSASPLARFVRRQETTQVMMAGRYTLLDRSGRSVLDEAAARGVGVIAAGVFNSGVLAAPRHGARFDYAVADDATVARALAIASLADDAGVPLRALAMQFPLRHPAVVGVAVGARTPHQVRDNAAMMEQDIPADVWAAVDELDPVRS